MMCDLTEYNGQYEVPLKLPVEKIEIAEEKVAHDDRNRRLVRIVLVRIENWRVRFTIWLFLFSSDRAFWGFDHCAISLVHFASVHTEGDNAYYAVDFLTSAWLPILGTYKTESPCLMAKAKSRLMAGLKGGNPQYLHTHPWVRPNLFSNSGFSWHLLTLSIKTMIFKYLYKY